MSFVTVPSNNIDLNDMYEQIDQTILYTRTYADEMREQLSSSINELHGLVGTYNPPVIDIDTSIAPIHRPAFPAKPLLPADESTCILDNLIETICNNILNGGNGLTIPVYNAIIAREQEARRISQEREYRGLLDAIGSLGFNLPSGHVAAMQIELTNERLSKDQESLNALRVKDFDLATENSKFAITSGMALEKLLRDSWNASADRIVNLYKTETDGIAAEYRSLMLWVTAEVDRIKMEASVAIENGRLGLDAYNSATALAEKVAEAIAGIASQSIASALGAINTSLSNGYSGSESRSESWGHSESLTESHNYEEV